MTRVAAALALALLAALAVAAPAPAAVLDPDDATELANALADATAEQRVCYGWNIVVSDPTGAEDGEEVGSNLGPGRPIDRSRPECARYAELQGQITYTSEYEDAEDSAFWRVESNLPNPPTVRDLADLGYEENDLLGDDNDLAILNAAGALPQLAAERSGVEAVPFKTERRAAGVGGEPTNTPGSDFLRENGTLLALCALLLVGGLVWLLAMGRGGGSRRHRTTSTTST